MYSFILKFKNESQYLNITTQNNFTNIKVSKLWNSYKVLRTIELPGWLGW